MLTYPWSFVAFTWQHDKRKHSRYQSMKWVLTKLHFEITFISPRGRPTQWEMSSDIHEWLQPIIMIRTWRLTLDPGPSSNIARQGEIHPILTSTHLFHQVALLQRTLHRYTWHNVSIPCYNVKFIIRLPSNSVSQFARLQSDVPACEHTSWLHAFGCLNNVSDDSREMEAGDDILNNSYTQMVHRCPGTNAVGRTRTRK